MTSNDAGCGARNGRTVATRRARASGALALLGALALATTDAQAVKPDQVFVKARTTFEIDQSLGWEQYHGTLRYARVEVISPPDGKVNNKIATKARKACLDLFVNGDGSGLYPGFIIYDKLDRPPEQGGVRRLSLQGDPFTIDDAGNWHASGFNSNDPAKRVRAQGGFWDSYYNYRYRERVTSFKLGQKTIVAYCDGDIAVEAEYPG